MSIKPQIPHAARSQTKSGDAFLTVSRELHRLEKPPIAGEQITVELA
ncbi:MAG TPA: hypothetical protein VFM63_01325 [Pyrinomonadaceae bacterium]|nr:hypothetical protein [Pyrinomonadaceae bacterium]